MSQVIEASALSGSNPFSAVSNATLDPTDWKGFRSQAHRMLDDMLDYIEHIRDRPVWQPIPDKVRAQFRSEVPRLPQELAAVHDEFMRDVLPFAAGNVHPGFMGWVHGGGTPVGMLAEMLAAGLNANLGGRDHAPVEVERQVIQWTREIFGFPDSATGLFVTGTSMANLIAVVIARDVTLGMDGLDVRREGMVSATSKLTAYASTAVHGCIGKAMDISGIGSDTLRSIATDGRHRIDLQELETAIQRDRDAGFTPFLVVGSAGTVDTGAIDDLASLADLCQREKLWFHVDGAYGALAKLAPDLASGLDGLERADSLAFDFHKWGQVPYDAGFILVRDGELHRNAFASATAYLQRAERGLAAGSPWLCDFGPDLSRGFRALKTWFTLKVYGTDALGAVISRTCALARYLEGLIHGIPELELMAPVELNIVCFRYRADESDRINESIVLDLQESGVVAPSTTRINGVLAIRAAIVNHRTSHAEIDALIQNTLSLGRTHQAKTIERRMQSISSIDLLLRQAAMLEKLGRSMEARNILVKLLALDPLNLTALNSMGNLLFAAEENDEARTMYMQAIAAHPHDPMSRVNFANLLLKQEELETAREHLEYALKLDPAYRPAHAGLSFVLPRLGDAELASVHRRMAFQGRCVIRAPYRGKEQPVTVLELMSTTGGNVRTKLFLSDRIFQRYLVTAEFYEPGITLPPHQLIVNAIGDADLAAGALAGAQSLLADSTAPVINAPAAVLATGRCEIARRLAGIAGVVTPKTLILPRESLSELNVQSTLSLHGFEFPLLLRTPGFHGGDHFLRVETSDELPEASAKLPGRDLLVIQYLDARGSDGKSRKYRVMMIDGKLYPLHAAISSNWKIHYFSAEMADCAKHRAEDAEFLTNMSGVIGPRAVSALSEMQKMLGLDYGGIDFGLNRNGDVLLFEANATMAFFPPDPDSRWDYRRPAVEGICQAVRTMLLERAM